MIPAISTKETRTFAFVTHAEAIQPHTYGYLWTEDLMSFSVDGIFYYTLDLKNGDFGLPKSTATYAFHDWHVGTGPLSQPQFLIYDNMCYYPSANGELQNGGLFNFDALPFILSVDYCRVYQIPGYGALYLPDAPGNGIAIDPDKKDWYH